MTHRRCDGDHTRHPRHRPHSAGPLSGHLVGHVFRSDHNGGNYVQPVSLLPARDQARDRRVQRAGDLRSALREPVQNRGCFRNEHFLLAGGEGAGRLHAGHASQFLLPAFLPLLRAHGLEHAAAAADGGAGGVGAALCGRARWVPSALRRGRRVGGDGGRGLQLRGAARRLRDHVEARGRRDDDPARVRAAVRGQRGNALLAGGRVAAAGGHLRAPSVSRGARRC